MKPEPRLLRKLILNAKQPIILRQFWTDWRCFQVSLADWCKHYDDSATEDQLGFERMRRKQSSADPQWERKRETVQMTATEFLQHHKQKESSEHLKDCDYWTAMNYKRASEIPVGCRAGVDFECFGFGAGLEEFNFWLGSAGANTPCHYDTFGCNIVVQVYGRKSWLLMPPYTPLTRTRIPYEESSVYCTENFYAPSSWKLKDFEILENHAYRCVLKPNDVLIVPRHWWHYVEALETSLAVNYWVPLKMDVDAQLEETIVKFLIESFVENEEKKVVEYMLNPNQLDKIEDDENIFAVLKYLVQKARTPAVKSRSTYDYQFLNNGEFEALIKMVPNAYKIPAMTKTELNQYLKENSKRFDVNSEDTFGSPLNVVKEMLINSICSSNSVKAIVRDFSERYEKSLIDQLNK